MNFRTVFLTANCFLIISLFGAFSQISAQNDLPPAPPRSAVPVGQVFTRRVPEPPAVLPAPTRERRQQSYAKLLEAQRYLWAIKNRRSTRAAVNQTAKPAFEALYRAVEINPGFAEAYALMAELAFMTGVEGAEIERLAKIALRFDADHAVAHQILSQIYTLRSGLSEGNLKPEFADKAVAEWRAIVRLDPRNAEAWAFLSEFYERRGETEKAVEALKNWSGAAALPLPDGGGFYRYVTGGGDAAPEAALVRLGRAYLRAGRAGEAIRVLSGAVADEPRNEDAVLALQDAVEAADEKDAAVAVEALKQAVYAAPGNAALVDILAGAQIRSGKTEDAARTIKEASAKLAGADKTQAAGLLVRLGGIYGDAGRREDALAAYEAALKLMDIENAPLANDNQKQFAARVVPLLVGIYGQENRRDEARAALARLRTLIGRDSAEADVQLATFLRASGETAAALQTVREARARFPEDASLLRLEAGILTDAGKIEEAVSLLRSKIVNKTKQVSFPKSLVADFIAHLTISDLYIQAKRGEDAVGAARQALDLAQNDEMTRIGMLTLASAQNAAGNFREAENALREILKKEPENLTALNNLGYFLVERGERLPEAVNLIKRAVAGEPSNSSFLDSLGWAYFRLNQLDDAEKNLSEAARRNPNSAAIQEHLGDLYEKQGKTEQAKTAWRKALTLLKQPEEIARLRAKLNDKK